MNEPLCLPPPEPPQARPPATIQRTSLLDAFLAGRSATTILAYQQDLDRFARWLGAASTAEALDEFLSLAPGDANAFGLAYRNAMIDARLAPATINRRMSALNSVVKMARTLGRVAWSLEVPQVRREPRRDSRGPDESEFKKLWIAAKRAGDDKRARRDRALIALAYSLALRRSEVADLDLADVDFAKGKLHVQRKGHREKLVLTMPTETARHLADWVVVRGSWPGPLFIRTDRPDQTERLNAESIHRAIMRLGKAAGLPRPVRAHGLRHAAVTAAVARRETVADVARFSGHARLETVMTYVDAFEDTQGRIARGNAKSLK